MKLSIEATEKLTRIDGVPVRVWKGRTESGAECFVFVHRIAVDQTNCEQFERELEEQLPPTQAFPLRNIL